MFINDNIIRIVDEQLSYCRQTTKSIKVTDTLNELGADSLDQVEILMSLEEFFNIDLKDEYRKDINLECTVQNLIDLINLKNQN